ncbi:hypothetical protein WA158_001962 [Blastocystis sp. Blastoise]
MSSLAKCLFIGTGTSEGIPILSCLFGDCKVCKDAMIPGSKNRRRNISVAISYKNTNIIIDCGKLWWDSALEVLPKNNIRDIDAFVISHEHADAIGGVDNLRDVTKRIIKRELPIYANAKTQTVMTNSFPYIFKQKDNVLNGGVPDLFFKTIENEVPFTIKDITLHPFFVPHGGCECTAFRIGKLCYISDVSSINDTCLKYINNSDILILDCIYPKNKVHPSHVSMSQLEGFFLNHCHVEQPPKQVYLVGMTHMADHNEFNQQLQDMGFHNVECAYDGQIFDFSMDE